LGTRFLRSKFLVLGSVLLLFFLWGSSLYVILSQAKIGETIQVEGRFSKCTGCGSFESQALESFCFDGFVTGGDVTVSPSETFLLEIKAEDNRKQDDISIPVTVGDWLVGSTTISLCLGTTPVESFQMLLGEKTAHYRMTLRRESLIKVLLLKK